AEAAAATDAESHQRGSTRPTHPGKTLIAVLSSRIQSRGYSERTQKAYVAWVQRFLRHAKVTRPEELGAEHARAFLEELAVGDRLAASSRNQAAAALAFMFREVLGSDEMLEVPRAKGHGRMPLVMTHGEVLRVLRELVGKHFLVAVLLYSAGLRLRECLQLRVKDIDFELRQILVRDGKGAKDRYVPLANRAMQLLHAQMRNVARRHQQDRTAGHGWAQLPGALHRKDPEAGYERHWQFVFPGSTIIADPATGRTGRWHLHPSSVQRSVKRAVRRSGITKRASCHTFRHSFATEALRSGCDIRTLQHVMGHKDIRTTMIYLHVIEQTGHHIRSPLDRPDEPEQVPALGGDLIDTPWMEPEFHWDLAAQQWGRAGKPK
ncbi:MAG: integron integrase, partial [Gemmatimonadota bacterium]